VSDNESQHGIGRGSAAIRLVVLNYSWRKLRVHFLCLPKENGTKRKGTRIPRRASRGALRSSEFCARAKLAHCVHSNTARFIAKFRGAQARDDGRVGQNQKNGISIFCHSGVGRNPEVLMTLWILEQVRHEGIN
jgi:hypothetical protein